MKALATSTRREKTVDLLGRAGIRDKFKAIICGDDVINSKLDPEIFLKAVEKLNVNPKRYIVLEDFSVYLEPILQSGWDGTAMVCRDAAHL